MNRWNIIRALSIILKITNRKYQSILCFLIDLMLHYDKNNEVCIINYLHSMEITFCVIALLFITHINSTSSFFLLLWIPLWLYFHICSAMYSIKDFGDTPWYIPTILLLRFDIMVYSYLINFVYSIHKFTINPLSLQ